MKKKILGVVMLLGGIFLLNSCIDIDKIIERKTYVKDDFIYATVGMGINQGEAAIIGISEEGKQKDTLVFPTMLGGYRVVSIGITMPIYNRYPNEFEITNENVYICDGYNYEVKISYKNVKKIYLMTYDFRASPLNVLDSDFEKYPDIYFYYKGYDAMSRNEAWEKSMEKIYCANITYYTDVNDDHSAFFVDDVDGDKISIIPPDPYKEGYEFKGWYKDVEFKNKWDFEKDIVPKKKYDENGKYIYEENGEYAGTKLYAKWEEV